MLESQSHDKVVVSGSNAPEPFALSERAITALRSAMQGQFRQAPSDYSLRRALRSLCMEARSRNLRAEQLILVFKHTWYSLPEARGTDARKKQEMLDRLVSICVEEYYATS